MPRCAFSVKQNTVIHWALSALGVKDVPSSDVTDRVLKTLQDICGVASIRYEGALGHIYYANDLAGIIAQEMSNPQVRPHLQFLPEDAGISLSQAWQASRWRDELDPELATPMVRHHGTDFFVHEPALLDDGRVCMPIRWFTRTGDIYAQAWLMKPADNLSGWVVLQNEKLEIKLSEFVACWANLTHTFETRGIPDPRCIIGESHGGISPLEEARDPQIGNRWRAKACGRRVVAFPIWLYCDDTSGNLSKKWNKHNSFLFTPAGLPRHLVHQEYNIHFLATSNIAPPLEMLDGIVEQLRDAQDSGVWAWDFVLKELVLVIPSVLAMLGDNPMQSEIACHVGLAGNLFCRVCNVWRGSTPPSQSTADASQPGRAHHARSTVDDDRGTLDSGSDSVHSMQDVETSSVASSEASGQLDTGRRRQRRTETLSEMVERIGRFMSVGTARTREATMEQLKSQFVEAQRIGGQTRVEKARTQTGVKDTYQAYFLDKLFAITTKRGRQRTDKEADVREYLKTVPHVEDSATSPVWRIRDFDPHSDTPVEILHVILLGFVKYLWRDTVSRLSDSDKKTVIARLSSFDVSGLGTVPPLSGSTLVTYAGSLVGRDFRAVAQAAPFVLHDLSGIPLELQKVWTALGHLVPLVWQPEIHDLPSHLIRLSEGIDHFLEATCSLTPRWFNKPKFHILLHLPRHIRRFGPAMLFATEGFESFNAVIRSHSIHSNHRAPSRDIARGMARHNRLRHILSGGAFTFPRIVDGEVDTQDPQPSGSPDETERPPQSPWLRKMMVITAQDESDWRTVASGPLSLLELEGFRGKVLGIPQDVSKMDEEGPERCAYSSFCCRYLCLP
ncbi:hypothetical protein NUW54_g2837 [Trametes sanguinea]|uniref:Uncharacterized protein n=1 Tax=Trametes sanguinea TaxID=158606 RepID=A0ACC1Q4P7_9APHY|nr:hypothetical protein NUW54_g2837 [Trametes sanguinea]